MDFDLPVTPGPGARCHRHHGRDGGGRFRWPLAGRDPGDPNADGLVDLEDWGAEYRLVRWVPDVRADQIRVQVEGRFVVVRTECDEPERRFEWQARVPEGVEEGAIHAEVSEGGVLTVILPKAEDPVRVIPVTEVRGPSGNAQRGVEVEDAANAGNAENGGWVVEERGGEYRLSRDVGPVEAEGVVAEVVDGRVAVSVPGVGGGAGVRAAWGMPPDVDHGAVSADVEDGTLTVVLPKAGAAAREAGSGAAEPQQGRGEHQGSASQAEVDAVGQKVGSLQIPDSAAPAEPSAPLLPADTEPRAQGAAVGPQAPQPPGSPSGDMTDWVDVMEEDASKAEGQKD
eukprot:evm.model.scf_866.3 EVM.evm.TU.scf_866.3   scf_866:51816-54004(+)